LQVLEYHVSADPNVADLSSRRVVLSVEDDSDIHNSGQLAFGPDGYLYITIGDDADASKGQATDTLDGKILRIDPRKNGASGYTVPGDNPFVGNGAFLPEIWAYGFRNPFRASFTPSGQFVIGEVGNGSVEEVDIGAAGANYGWNVCEGPCDPLVPGFTEPIYSYPHAGSGCRGAIIGGVYVADPTLTGYTGRYLFGDYCFATFGTLSLTTPGGDYQPAALTIKSPSLDSFGTDSKGCVYVMADSTAYRLAANAGDGPACPLTSAGSGDLPGAAAKPQILGSKLRASSKGWVKVHVYCAASANCTGRVTIRSARRIRSHGKLKTLTFGTTVYKNLGQRSSRAVRVTLKKDAFKFLKRRGKIRVKVTATSKSAASPATASASKALSLYAPKH
jgi:hypothetical protein